MIRVPTTFVIGAGASAELDFPTGPGLLRDISELLQFGSQFDRVNGSSAALDIGLAYARLTGQSRINPSDPFYDAAARVRSAADIARSIDNVIDQNDDDPLVEMVGRLICRPATGPVSSRCFIMLLPDDSEVVGGLCEAGSFIDQSAQFPDRRQGGPRGSE